MRAEQIVQRLIAVLNTEVHLYRLNAVSRAVIAILRGGRVTLTGIGRAMDGSSPKHFIKAADRLLGNVRLHSELALFYLVVAQHTLPREGRPLLLIDWTDIGTLWAVLTVTLVTDGRGVVIYSQGYRRRRENDPRLEASCLRALQKVLGHRRPILISDAGFRGPWMKKVRAAGWDFVTRVRGNCLVQLPAAEAWKQTKAIWGMATTKPRCLGLCALARRAPELIRLVLVRQRAASRKALPKAGRRKKKQILSAREPWVLATSLEAATAKDVVSLYKTRMRIEETFRDQKCPRFGWGLDEARTKSLARVNVLLMLAAVAHYVALLIGTAVEAAGLHRRFQANTVRNRRTLSLARLAHEVLLRLPAHELTDLLAPANPGSLPIVVYP